MRAVTLRKATLQVNTVFSNNSGVAGFELQYNLLMLRIARRGAWGYAPENTLAAFRKATQIDCDVVEFDVHRTKDGHIMVMHDHNVRRTTGAIGNIHDLTLHELRKFHESNGESVPTLEEVIAIVAPTRRLMVDIKDRHMEESVLDALRRNHVIPSAIMDSDFEDVIVAIRTLNRQIAVFLGGCFCGKWA